MAFFGLINSRNKKKFDRTLEPFESAITTPLKENTMQKQEDKTDKVVSDKKPDNMTKEPPKMQQKLVQIPPSPQISMKQYDILVVEEDDDGRPIQKQVSGVMASSPQELQMLYAADGAKIRILREYGGQPSPQPPLPQPPSPPPASQPQMAQPLQPVYSNQTQFQAIKSKEPPKYFNIGGINCKLEDGKMFQEQWVRVDSSKYRLISDANNKTLPMNGKHLECLKWILVDNNQEENVENA